MATINRSLGALKRPTPRTLTRELRDAHTGTVVSLTLRALDGMERMAAARHGRELVQEWGSEQRNPQARSLGLPVSDDAGNAIVIQPDDEFLYAVAMLETMEVPPPGEAPWNAPIWGAIALTEGDIWQQACLMVQELAPMPEPEQVKDLQGVGITGSASAPVSTGDSPTRSSSEPSSSTSATSDPSCAGSPADPEPNRLMAT